MKSKHTYLLMYLAYNIPNNNGNVVEPNVEQSLEIADENYYRRKGSKYLEFQDAVFFKDSCRSIFSLSPPIWTLTSRSRAVTRNIPPPVRLISRLQSCFFLCSPTG